MRFIFKTDYAQDIGLVRHGGQLFWYGLLMALMLAAPMWAGDYALSQLSFVLVYAIAGPMAHAGIALVLGWVLGMSSGNVALLMVLAASASYIAAPPAVRMTLPEANPTFYLTAALAITFPFNLLAGIPIYFEISKRLCQ